MKRPNFLFIITDQHRADYLGCAGHPIVMTPHIDSLAARGTRFENFHVATPVCMPNRASLLTGRYPSAHGLRYNGGELAYRASTFTHVLREGGYRTALIGKNHVQPMTNQPAEPRIPPERLGPIAEAWRSDDQDYDNETPHRYQGNELYRLPSPYYGYDHVDIVTGHGHRCGGHYEQWLRSQHPAIYAAREQQLPHTYICPQATRTAIPEELYSTSFIRDRAVDFLDGTMNDDAPFFAFVSFPDPHHPFSPPGKYWDMYSPDDFSIALPYERHQNPTPPMRWLHKRWQDGKRFAEGQEAFMASEQEIKQAMALTCGMITMVDDAIGAVLDALERSGKADDTVVVFTSDHGDYLGDFNMLLKGGIMLRSVTRVPFIWSDPQNRSPALSQSLGSTIDLAPTIIDRAGLKPYFGIQGTNLMPAIRGAPLERRNLIVEHQDNMTRMGFPEPCMARTIISDDHRLTIYKGETWGELYDLNDDPNETRNLWDDPSKAGLRAQLFEELVQAMLTNVDQSPRGRMRA